MLWAHIDDFVSRREQACAKRPLTFGRRLGFALVCALVSIVYAFPGFTGLAAPVPRLWEVVSHQIDHPLEPMAGLDPASHESKRTFRLTAPLIGKLIPSSSIRVRMIALFGIQYIAGVVFFAVMFELFLAAANSQVAAQAFTLCLAFTFPGQAFFTDLNGFFDGYAFVLLGSAMLLRNRMLMPAILFAACWVDERAILALALVYLWFGIRDRSTGRSWMTLAGPNQAQWLVVVVAILTIAGRQALSQMFDLPIPHASDGGNGMLRYLEWTQLYRLPIGYLTALKALWAPVLLAIVALALRKQWTLAALVSIGLFAFLSAGIQVWDLTRTLGYAFPLALIGVKVLGETESPRTLSHFALCSLVASALIPSYMVMAGIFWIFPLPVKLLVSPWILLLIS